MLSAQATETETFYLFVNFFLSIGRSPTVDPAGFSGLGGRRRILHRELEPFVQENSEPLSVLYLRPDLEAEPSPPEYSQSMSQAIQRFTHTTPTALLKKAPDRVHDR